MTDDDSDDDVDPLAPVPTGHPPVPRGAQACQWAKPIITGDEFVDWEHDREQAMQNLRPGELDWGFSVGWLIAAWLAMLMYSWGPDLGLRTFVEDSVRCLVSELRLQ